MRCALSFLLACLAAAEGRAAAQEETEGAAAPPDEIHGAPPAFDLSADREEAIRIEADAPLHRQPALRSPVLTRLAAAADLPLLERRGPWVRVRYGSWLGWVHLEGQADDLQVPMESETPAEPWWQPRSGPDPERLERALGLLEGGRVGSLGPYVFHTDVDNEAWLGKLAVLAEQLPEIFRERYGLEAEPGENETVVLYKREESYRAYVEGDGDPVAADSLGHAVGGLAVLSAGRRKRDEVASLLTHELTHLMTYRALGPDLPPWLAEGLAEDLAYCRTASSGRLIPDTLDGWRSTVSEPVRTPGGGTGFIRITTRGGPEASLEEVRMHWRESALPPFAVLIELSRLDFMAADFRRLHYSTSAFLIRFLLDSDDTAAGFRAYLRTVARGDRGGAAELASHLGKDWPELESGFGDWLMSGAPLRGPKKR